MTDEELLKRLREASAKAPGRDPEKYISGLTVAEAGQCADAIERLTREVEEWKTRHGIMINAQEYLKQMYEIAERERDEARAALAGIREYWNGSRTDGAMFDALTEIERRVDEALAPREGGRG
jgi:hypothetical protein